MADQLLVQDPGTSSTLTPEELLQSRLNEALAFLAAAAGQRDTFLALLQTVFGSPGTDAAVFSAAADGVIQQLLSGALLSGLSVALASGEEMQGALGAYAVVGADGRETVYINSDWLLSASSDAVLAVLLEEIGHAIDTRLNAGTDSAGDEGELFSLQLLGGQLSAEQLAAIQVEDDSTTLTIDGVQVSVEQDYPTSLTVFSITGDNGSNTSDFITTNTTIVMSGTVGVADTTNNAAPKLYYSLNSGTKTQITISYNDAANSATFSTVSVSGLSAGLNAIRFFDSSGGGDSSAFAVKYIWVGMAPTITAAERNSGRGRDPVRPEINDITPTLKGFGMPGARVRIYFNGSAITDVNTDATVASDGSWSYIVPESTALPYGLCAVTVSFVGAFLDANLNDIQSSPLALNVLFAPPEIWAATAYNDQFSANLTESDVGVSAAGTLTVTDENYRDTVSVAVDSFSASGTTYTDQFNLQGSATPSSWLTFSPATGLAADETNAGAPVLANNVIWTFNSGTEAFDYLAAGETLQLRYVVRATDNVGATSAASTAVVTINITGTNDGPVLQSSSGNSDQITRSETNVSVASSASEAALTAIDPDLSDTLKVRIVSTASVTLSNGASLATQLAQKTPTTADLLSYLYFVNPDGVTTTLGSTASKYVANFFADPSSKDNLRWGFQAAPGAFDYLPQGTNIKITYRLEVQDPYGLTASRDVYVTINGVNSLPVITVGPATGSVTEAGSLDNGTPVPGMGSATGQFTATDVDTGATLAWSIGGTPATTYGTMAINASTGVWTYTLDNTKAATEALREGQSVTQTYSAVVTDEYGATDTEFITITITGTNDAPVINTGGTSGSGTEAGSQDDGTLVAGVPTVTGQVTATDVDQTSGLAWSIQSGGPLTYGSMVIDSSTGVWTYSLDNADTDTQGLKEGQSVTQTYTAVVTDAFGASDTETITVLITGTNDAPLINTGGTSGSGTEAGSLDNGSPVAGVATVTGQLTATDVDQASGFGWILQSGGPLTYGSMVIDSSTGVWTYSLDNADTDTQGLKEGQSVTQTYTAVVTDEFGASGTKTITVLITGTNDAPVINTGGTSGSGTEAGSQDDGISVAGVPTVTGELTATDVDQTSGLAWSIQSGGPLTYGSMVIDSSTGVWTYSLNNADSDTQGLKEGQSVTQTYTAVVTDEFGAWGTKTITVLITGTNDAPLITSSSAAAAGSVWEAGTSANGTTYAGTSVASGQLVASDVDSGAVLTWAVQPGGSTTYGSFSIVASTGAWSYQLDNSLDATQALKEGESVSQSYVVTVTDEFGAAATQTITVLVTGSNDAPIVSSAEGKASVQYAEAVNLTFYGRDVEGDALTGYLTLGSFGTFSVASGDMVTQRTFSDAGTMGENLTFSYGGFDSKKGHYWKLTGFADLNAYAGTAYTAMDSAGNYTPTSASYSISFSVSDASVSSAQKATLVVNQRPATLTYTGSTSFYTSSTKSTSAKVLMEGLLESDAGARTSGMVQFSWKTVNGTTWTTSTWQNVTTPFSVSPNKGYSSYYGSLGAGSSGATTYLVRMAAGANYSGVTPNLDLTAVTVIQAGGSGFMAGGGTIGKKDMVTGAYLGILGTNAISFVNFGFNTKYNKSNTNLTGNTLIIIRGQFDSDKDLDTYMIKSNATDVLVSQSDGSKQFTAQANVFDLDNNNATIASKCALKAIGYDGAKTGTVDRFAFSLSGDMADAAGVFQKGALLFSTGYDDLSTLALTKHGMSGGNIHVG